MWQGNGYNVWDLLRLFLGHNFVSGLLTLKARKKPKKRKEIKKNYKNWQNLKTFSKKTIVFFQPWNQPVRGMFARRTSFWEWNRGISARRDRISRIYCSDQNETGQTLKIAFYFERCEVAVRVYIFSWPRFLILGPGSFLTELIQHTVV